MSDGKPRTTALKNVVKDSASQLGIRNTTLQVLFALLDCINSRTMEARIGRPKLMKKLGRCEKSIKNAMRDLRRIGLIYPVKYPRAAPGKTPVYKFRFTREAVEAFNERNYDRPFEPLAHGEFWHMDLVEIRIERGEKITPRSEGDEEATRGKIFLNEGKKIPLLPKISERNLEMRPGLVGPKGHRCAPKHPKRKPNSASGRASTTTAMR
jgi:predicted transcriptional regulator